MRLLEVVGLAKRFGALDALAGVSFTVQEGHVVALVGPPGAGKSTCLACIAGALVPDGGRIVFDGRDITREPAGRPERAGILRSPPGSVPAFPARLLLFDEDSDGLAPDAVRSVVEALPALRAQGVTVIVSARRLEPLRDSVDQVIVLNHGRTVAAGPASGGPPREES